MIQISASLSLFLSLVLAAGVTPEINRLLAFAEDRFDPPIVVTRGNSAGALVERFGLPLKVEKRSGPDGREPGVITEAELWHYDGLQFSLVGDYGSTRRGITQITLTSPKYKLKFDLAIGSPREAFRERLGPPNAYHSTSEWFTYRGLGSDYDVWTN
jgi:hypothetical protein